MEVIVMMILLYEPDIKVLVVEPTKSMCDAAQSRLTKSAAKIGQHDVIARLGLHDESGEDHVQRFVVSTLQKQNTGEAIILEAVDNCISLFLA